MKKEIIPPFLIIMLFFSVNCIASDSLRVISHNVLAFSGHPTDIHISNSSIIERAAEYYSSLRPDILVLQECPGESTIAYLAERLGYNYVFLTGLFKGNKNFPYGFPGAVLSPYKLTSIKDINLVRENLPDSIFQRHAGQVIVETESGNLSVTGLHLCADFDNRSHESTRLAEISALMNTLIPCDSCWLEILAGDFNSLPGSKPYQTILAQNYIDTNSETPYPTVPVPDSKYRIDYIFLKSSPEVKFFAEKPELPYDNESGLFLSDHLPCIRIFVNQK